MMILLDILALVVGFFLWYFIFGVECYMNGGPLPSDWSMPFRGLVQDLSFNLPGGWERRLRFAEGDEEWAKQFPGWWHIYAIHVCLPLFPFGVVRLIRILFA